MAVENAETQSIAIARKAVAVGGVVKSRICREGLMKDIGVRLPVAMEY